jgi:hypothetical protein
VWSDSCKELGGLVKLQDMVLGSNGGCVGTWVKFVHRLKWGVGRQRSLVDRLHSMARMALIVIISF